MTNTGAFQAIVRKEMRENIVWAALGLILTYVVLIGALPSSSAQSSPNLISVFSITALAAIVGLMIGRAQGISENRGDPWGFLVHRPVSRSTLFWGKVAAGVLLYAGAIAIPAVCVAVWLSIPGRVAAPFDWRMTLPAVADLTCGVAFYFGGLLTAMREARWYASRALGIGVGFICATAILTLIHTFWLAMAFCAAGIIVAAIAARGTFIAAGQYASQSRTSRVAVGVAIASGLAVIGFFAVNVTMLLTFPAYQLPQGQQTQSRRYAMSSDGTVVQLVENSNGDLLAVKDLQGNLIDKYNEAAARKAVRAGVSAAQVNLNPVGIRDLAPPPVSGYRSAMDIYTAVESKNTQLHWYYIHDRGLIAAYDIASKRLVGWLGPDGFTDGATLPTNRFHGTTQSFRGRGPLIAFPDAVYDVDVDNRHVSKIFDAPPGETIVGADRSSPMEGISSSSDTTPGFDAIATEQRIYVQSEDRTPRMSIARDPKADGYGIAEVLQASQAPGAPMFVWYLPMGGSKFQKLSQAYYQPQYVSQIRSDGSAVNPVEVPPYGVLVTNVKPYLSDAVMMTLTMPLALNAVIYTLLRQFLTPGQSLAGWLWPSLFGLVIAGILFAKGRRNAFTSGQLLTWTALGFGLGLLGLALMYSLIDWPSKESCPSCKRQRVVTRERCEHCNEAFSAPAGDGTEIFEPAEM